MYRKLIELADSLDRKGLYKEANELDDMVKEFDTELDIVEQKEREEEHRKLLSQGPEAEVATQQLLNDTMVQKGHTEAKALIQRAKAKLLATLNLYPDEEHGGLSLIKGSNAVLGFICNIAHYMNDYMTGRVIENVLPSDAKTILSEYARTHTPVGIMPELQQVWEENASLWENELSLQQSPEGIYLRVWRK